METRQAASRRDRTASPSGAASCVEKRRARNMDMDMELQLRSSVVPIGVATFCIMNASHTSLNSLNFKCFLS